MRLSVCNVIVSTPYVGCGGQRTMSSRFSLPQVLKIKVRSLGLQGKHFYPVSHCDGAWDSVVNDTYRITIMCPIQAQKPSHY